MFHPSLERLALDLFNCGAVKFGAFKLKHHEKNPDAPLSPFYFELRTADHPNKPGPLTMYLLEDIGRAMLGVLQASDVRFGAVCGIPDAGVPLAKALATEQDHHYLLGITSFVDLVKETRPDGTRRIVRTATRQGDAVAGARKMGIPTFDREVVLVDDVITRAATKLEAIDALKSSGWNVEAVAVVVDRGQGGSRDLYVEHGIATHALFKVRELMEFYLAQRLISEDMYDGVIRYLDSET